MIRVVVAEHNPVLRFGLRTLLSATAHIAVVGEAADGTEAVEGLRTHHPDVLLVDIQLPKLASLTELSAASTRTRIVVVTGRDDPDVVLRAIAEGAAGYLVHGQYTTGELVNFVLNAASEQPILSRSAVAALVNGFRGRHGPPLATLPLTPREREVMALVALGLSNREIAHRLVVSEKTVKNHVHHIYKRLKVTSRQHAIALWRQHSPVTS
jgi:DNA-binding NarL/FixJ family response regulator